MRRADRKAIDDAVDAALLDLIRRASDAGREGYDSGIATAITRDTQLPHNPYNPWSDPVQKLLAAHWRHGFRTGRDIRTAEIRQEIADAGGFDK